MEIFNIGLPELILILLIMLIVLGPERSIIQMKNVARFVRKLVQSPMWADIMNTSREIKELPTKMIRESGIDEEITQINRQLLNSENQTIKSIADAGGKRDSSDNRNSEANNDPTNYPSKSNR